MAEVKVGVLAAGEVLGPMSTPKTSKWGLDQPSTWAIIFFVCAILYLVVL